MPRWPLILLFASSCARHASDVDTGDARPIDTDIGPLDTTVQCPDDRPVLGAEGAFHDDTFRFTWEWDDDLEMSYSNIVYAEVPEDTTSLALTLDAGTLETSYLLFEVGGDLWVDPYEDWGEPPFAHYPDPAAGFVLPINDETWPEPGCLAVLPLLLDYVEDDVATLHIVTRRYEAGEGLLDINIIVVDGTTIYQEELDDAVAAMNAIYEDGDGPAIGEVRVFEHDNPGGDVVPSEGPELQELLSVVPDGPAQAMNIIMVSDFSDSTAIGQASGIPGALGVAGTANSAVIVAIDPHLDGSGSALDTQFLGETLAHEVGHQMGLFHTTESDGESDYLDDTPACPLSADDDGDGELTAEECLDYDGRNFMFWTGGSVRQTDMSTSQSNVLYFSPASR